MPQTDLDPAPHITFTVDDQPATGHRGQSVLAACLQNGVYIPHLCYLEGDQHSPAACRLCFVQIQGQPQPAAACTTPITAGMHVLTTTASVRQLQKSALRLLLSVHRIDGKRCSANGTCQLQRIARHLGVGLNPRPLPRLTEFKPIDHSHPWISHDPNHCVLCGRCVRICRRIHDLPQVAMTGRGFDTQVRLLPAGPGPSGELCRQCLACVKHCPVGALISRIKPLA